ncbi:retrovirus-related pol polyprotein from transposon TNT 1-94, partial [Tanacetum coccineum]
QLNGKSPVTQCESPNFDSRIQKIEDKNVSLAFQELLEEVRALKPLDEHIGHASKFAEQIQELLVYVSASCPFTQSGNEKWALATSYKRNNKPYVDASRTKQTIETITQKHVIVETILWYLDSGCFKHMNGHRDKLINFVSKFIGLGHNLFSVGQFCDSDLKVALRKHTCFVRNLEGVDLLPGSRGSNLYTISMVDMMKSSLVCLLSKASKTKSWLWHRLLSHLNFDTINLLAKQGLVKGLPKLKYTIDHLCSTCKMGKSKKESHPYKPEPSTNEKLQMLHMDLYGLMQMKDEAPEIIIKILKQAQVSLNATVGITYNTSTARTPQQNSIVEGRNCTLVEAARTMLIFSKSLLFLWAEAVATACYTQNRSLIHTRYNKTPYELLRDGKPELKYLYVFRALCYPTNDFKDLGKLQQKADIGIFIANPPIKNDWDVLFQPMFDEYFKPPCVVSTLIFAATLLPPDTVEASLSSTSIDKDAPSPSTSPNNETTSPPINSTNGEEPHNEEVTEFDSDTFTNPFAPPNTSSAKSSSRIVDTSNM